ncbi:MAG: hypothetical protein IPH54_17875 [Rhodoferax sp.]|nr:hypothetical protein [Rhodoferax sp.]
MTDFDWQRRHRSRAAQDQRGGWLSGRGRQSFDQPCYLFDVWPEASLRGTPGAVIACRETALLRATLDGAVWIGHVKRADSIKLPATLAFESEGESRALCALE